MASATATTNPDEHLRVFAGSRIARIIFLWNFVGLAILVLGVLLLSETRAGLTQAQVRNLRTQGELIANLLVETNTVYGDPLPGFNEPGVREVLRRVLPPVTSRETPGPRVMVFDADGREVADTNKLYDVGAGSPLPPVSDGTFGQSIERAAREVEYLRITPWQATITLEEEQRRAMMGEFVAGQRLNEYGQRVVSVSLPVRRVQAVLGVVTLESADVERILVAERVGSIPFIVGATVVVILSSILLTLFIASPLKRLASAADRLRLSGATRLDLPEVSKRKDEIGALGQSLEAMTDALADRIDANERFAADVSHEIKNPLASIRSAVESALNIKDAERQNQLLGIVAQDVRRLDRLITDIARASRIETETARGADSRVDLGRLLADITQAYASQLHDQDKAPRIMFRGPVPVDAIVLGQESALGQVFRNLIDNALSFSPEGGLVTAMAEVVKSRDGAFARAKIEDQGPGIPPENLETVFERFYTQRPKGAAFGGNSGLGLSIARQIVTAQKGRIYGENIEAPGGGRIIGARFIVELPLAGGRA